MKQARCISTSADARYFPALIALLRSLRRTNAHLPVIVFDGGLTRGQVRKAKAFAQVLPREPLVAIEGKGKFSYIGNTTLLKLEAAGLAFEEVLYLDADMIVLENLDPLFDLPPGSVGAVPEVNAVKNMFRLKYREELMRKIDIDWERPGFNAGLFALRPEEWRDLPEKVNSLVSMFGMEVFSKSKDQQLLNIIFSGRIHAFPGRYNFSPFYDDISACKPAVIHYLSECKPWHPAYPAGFCYEEFRSNIRVTDLPEIMFIDMRRWARRIGKRFT